MRTSPDVGFRVSGESTGLPRGLAIGVMTVLLVAACGGGASPTASTTSAAVTPAATSIATATPAGEIVIGGVGPLSQPGDVAIGTEMKWAMEQAIADLNAKGGDMGRHVRMALNDTKNQPS